MNRTTSWRLGVAMIIIGALANMIAACLLVSDKGTLIVIFAIAMIILLGGLLLLCISR